MEGYPLTCKHCVEFVGGNLVTLLKHEKKCKTHLFCWAACEKGRAALIRDVTLATIKALDNKRRGK